MPRYCVFHLILMLCLSSCDARRNTIFVMPDYLDASYIAAKINKHCQTFIKMASQISRHRETD